MLRILPIMKRSLLTSAVVVLAAGFLPVAAFADDPTTCSGPPPSSTAGVHRPVGADASTYVYNCDTGLWENAHFSYDPATGLTTAKDPDTYVYNAVTGQYDNTLWIFNAPKGDYDPYVQSVSIPPAGAIVIGAPAPVAADSTINNTGTDSNNTIDGTGGVSGTISDTGTGSNNNIGGSNANNLTANNTTGANFNNVINGNATTGNALVLGNTTAGNATTGNAQDIANVVNMLQSTSNALSGNTVTFVANINGDVNGDLLLDPSTLGTIQPASASGQNNLTLNNTTNAAINNNINLAAQSGDAAVADNTTAGNATSGSAQAIANVVNVINSAINAGKSFVGVININGNLNGDILLPQNFLDQLIASNVPTVSIDTTGTGSNNAITTGGGNTATINNTNNYGATNTITASAVTGNASVTGNTHAGNATTGNASNTSITAFNLTGSTVIGGNDLLVFVNVSGKWVGMIVNAPAGATAAELGGGITTNSQDGSTNATINNTTNAQINNNINLAAQSGNASVTGNTTGGNATTGDAKTAANLLNVYDSHLTLANWFGILFINVFGNWNGSFGVNTSAGDPVASSGPSAPATNSSSAPVPAQVRVFRFVPANNSDTTTDTPAPTTNNAVLAAHIKRVATIAPAPTLPGHHSSFMLPIVFGIMFIVFVVIDRVYAATRRS